MKSAKFDLHSKRKRIVLINRGSLFTLALMTLSLLWVLQPNRDLLIRMMDSAQDPNIAIAFLKVLQDHEQPSAKLDYSLARQYFRLAQYQSTRGTLTPIERFDGTDLETSANSLYASTLLNLTLAGDASARQRLEQYLLSKTSDVEAANIDQFSNYALQIGRPNIAYYIRNHASSLDHARLLNLARQGNLPGRAVEHAYQLYLQQPNQQNFAQTLNLYEALSQFDKGFALYQQQRQKGLCQTQCEQAMVAFSLSANQPKQAAYFAIMKANSSTRVADWLQASELSSMAGDSIAARYWLEKVASVDAQESHLEKLHNFARWRGQTALALDYSKRLIAINSTPQRLRDAFDEASAIADIKALSDFSYGLALADELSKSQQLQWVDNNDKAFGAKATVLRLQTLHELFPESSLYWAQLARFHGFVGDASAIAKLWDAKPATQPLVFEDAKYFADAFINLGQPHDAMQVHQQVDSVGSLAPGQIAEMQAIAQYSGNLEQERRFQLALLKSDAQQADPFRLVELMDVSDVADRTVLWSSYQQTGSLVVLGHLLNHGLVSQDPQLVEQVANALEAHRQDDSQLALGLRLQVEIYRNQLTQAQAIAKQLLASYPNDSDSLLSSLWIAIQLDQQQWLEKLYWQAVANHSQDISFYPVLGFGASKLGLFSHAEHWYQLLAGANKLRVSDKLSWSLVAQQQGNEALAQRLRWEVFSRFSDELKQLPQGQLSYRSLVAVFASMSYVQLNNDQAIVAGADGQTIAYGLTMRSDFTLQKYRYWQAFQLLEQAHLSDSVVMSIAIANRDYQTLQVLARDSIQLSDFERATALDLLSENFAAWQMGEQALTPSLPKQQIAPLQRFLADIHTEHSHGIRFEHTQQQTWGVATEELTYYRPLFDGWFNFDALAEHGTPTTDLLDDYQGERYHVSWRGQPWGWFERVEAELMAYQRHGTSTFGQSIGVDVKGSARVSHQLKLSHQMPTTQSENLALLGHEDRLEWIATWQPTRHEQALISLSSARFSSDFDDEIGSQLKASVRISEQLSREPGWQVYAQYDHQNNRISEQPLYGLSEYLGPNLNPNADQFLQPRYRKLTIGQHLVHGDVGVPGPDATPPRYYFDTSVEYDFITRRVGYGLSLGVGIPIVGGDELFFKTRWQSADQNNRESLVWNFGYFIDF
ncbi:tetratricopeptide repeat protein [Paraferrimonas haliotis]|uniref:PelB C-terminal domain-containing protein n=1 Tax=Paraferrimonas haliotis TaxID=2013866 RepID=A0AA37TR74_9GAMM|nr:tetratricopeptide repeat protein [Paraferrimonas haliotis]GLS84083.1 hypothetical protein GCM10007894_20600 [Paraferrimonas haliotis]